jgi:hypothetical protein
MDIGFHPMTIHLHLQIKVEKDHLLLDGGGLIL